MKNYFVAKKERNEKKKKKPEQVSNIRFVEEISPNQNIYLGTTELRCPYADLVFGSC